MSMNVTDEGIKDAMTLDQLLEEQQSAKASGLVKGDEKVTFGLGFLSGSLTVKSVVVGTTIDGTMAVALTPESELEWANHAKEEG